MVSRLFSEADSMTFDDVCKIVFNMEAVEKSASVISGSDMNDRKNNWSDVKDHRLVHNVTVQRPVYYVTPPFSDNSFLAAY